MVHRSLTFDLKWGLLSSHPFLLRLDPLDSIVRSSRKDEPLVGECLRNLVFVQHTAGL
jgi:hypothetical protein